MNVLIAEDKAMVRLMLQCAVEHQSHARLVAQAWQAPARDAAAAGASKNALHMDTIPQARASVG
jgi:hypothetical protein